MVKVCLTGGGTLGHVTPNLVLAEFLHNNYAAELVYVGSKTGMEREAVCNLDYIKYYSIPCDKLRRYFTLRNLLMPFVVLAGVLRSLFILSKERPDVVFMSGGYVGLPVVLAAYILNIPITLYDADMSINLANRISSRFAKHVFVNFAPLYQKLNAKYDKQGCDKKVTLVGPFIRPEFNDIDPQELRKSLGFSRNKPILLVFGGSQGSQFMNELILRVKYRLLETFQIIHVLGKGKSKGIQSSFGYKAYEFIGKGFASYMALSDVVVCRAGASAISELLFLNKPHMLIPLPRSVSRGDQDENANYFNKLGTSVVLKECQFSDDMFVEGMMRLLNNKDKYISAMQSICLDEAAPKVAETIMQLAKKTTA